MTRYRPEHLAAAAALLVLGAPALTSRAAGAPMAGAPTAGAPTTGAPTAGAPMVGGIQWFTRLGDGLAEARRTGRPILFLSAAPSCGGVPGTW